MATARYKKLKDYENNLWTYGSPVIIEKMVLYYDSLVGVNVLRITFRNVSKKKLYGLGISLTLKTSHGEKIKTIDFNYYAIEVATGKTFGADEDIIVEEKAELFTIVVNRADLANGKNFNDRVTLERMPNPIPLSLYVPKNYEEEFIARATAKYPKIKLLCAPEKREDFWRCTCTKIWPNEEIDKCIFCKCTKEELFGILPQIKKEEKERLEAEQMAKEEAALAAAEHQKKLEEAAALAEAEKAKRERTAREEAELRAEEEAKLKAEEEKKQKRTKRVLISSASVLVCFCVAAFWIIPTLQSYHESRINKEVSEETQIKPVKKSTSGGMDFNPNKFNPTSFVPICIQGEDLSKADSEILWRLLDGSSATEDVQNVSVSTEEGHAYMDGLIGRSNVEQSAVSGVLIKPKERGGINIRLYNITYYTESDYREQIGKLGIENADIVVAAPTPASGSTAMLGLLKYSGQTVSQNGQAIAKIVSKTNMNIRVSNSIISQRIATVKTGTELSVMEVMDNSWYKIEWADAENGIAYTSNYHGDYYDLEYIGNVDDYFIMDDEEEKEEGLKPEEVGEYQFEISD